MKLLHAISVALLCALLILPTPSFSSSTRKKHHPRPGKTLWIDNTNATGMVVNLQKRSPSKKHKHHPKGADNYELTRESYTFQRIQTPNVQKSSAQSDNWKAGSKPAHPHRKKK